MLGNHRETDLDVRGLGQLLRCAGGASGCLSGDHIRGVWSMVQVLDICEFCACAHRRLRGGAGVRSAPRWMNWA
ncbi:hypothetical protein QJS66_21800 [Kocuria rhizophila]|nr:hypothetical protein QJS66_21800 [Kocuria rhizophila]